MVSNAKLKEVADRINEYLKRFAEDPTINVRPTPNMTPPYHRPLCVYWGGARVRLKYVSYHGEFNLTKAEAVAYLQWLDAGNVGKHFQVPE